MILWSLENKIPADDFTLEKRMGEKNEGWDSRALSGVGMKSPVPSGAPSRVESLLHKLAAPGARRAPPLSAVLIRRDAAPDLCRSARTSSLLRGFSVLFLGTERVYPHCEHHLHQIAVIQKKKKIIWEEGAHQALAAENVLGYEAVISSSRIRSLSSSPSPKSAAYLNFSFQESHKLGFVLY